MGLDMFLSGKKYMMYDAPERKEEGFKIEEVHVELGYWRKVPDLHGYIVENFGPIDSEGQRVDDCNPIELSMDDVKQIIEAVQKDELPHTEGFFFGASAQPGDEYFDQEKADTLTAFGHAVQWLSNLNKERAYYYVIYRASW